jgi:hypothetical protein
VKKLLMVIALLALGYLVWSQWDRLRPLRERVGLSARAEEIPPSPELAERAGKKLKDLERGKADRVAFQANELQSLLQFRYQQLLPAFVDSPRIALEDGRIAVHARVPVERLPSISELGEAAGFLPDTAEVDLIGQILPLDSGRVALAIDQVRAARIPLPQRLVPKALRRLGRKDEPGLPADALALPLPAGAASAYVRADSLILMARPISRTNH